MSKGMWQRVGFVAFSVAVMTIACFAPKRSKFTQEYAKDRLLKYLPPGGSELSISTFRPSENDISFSLGYQRYSDLQPTRFALSKFSSMDGVTGVYVSDGKWGGVESQLVNFEFRDGKMIEKEICKPIDEAYGQWIEKMAIELYEAVEEAF